MKWRPKTLHNAMLPIMILTWVTGLSLFEYPLQTPQLGLSFVYIFINTSAYYYAYSHEPIIEILNQNGIRHIVFKILKYANFFISACCVIIGWHYYRAYKIIIKRLELLDEALENLGIPNNYRAILINCWIKTFIWITMIVVVISFDIHFLIQRFDFGTCLHLCYLLHYPIHLNSVVDFTFTSILK
ncbi:uncharacterized protein LOC117182715 [Belonocnema kinseyi]|uniref:uncharacterized protein LOC117182715 n=1 Tax=Belonocnema kinseyi TaxID=2817044 RepID=UPI00143DF22D|nr:uncharacterized protein LOC117182715 [Belonocnema kinseyi]